MRRGFMAEAAALACEVRAELEIGKFTRLGTRVLAGLAGIPIWALSAMLNQCPDAGHLLTAEPDVFSAVTVFAGPRRTIVHNDGHLPVRQSSNLARELSHALLHHPPSPALVGIGNRIWNQDIEDEAAYLAGCLLMTPGAALVTARGRWTMPEAAARFGISEQMVSYRINKTGARHRVKRAQVARR